MRVKRIKVGIKSWEENKKELRAIFRRTGQREQLPAEETLYFTDLETFRKCLTPKRLALLWTVAEKHPQSVRELAGLVRREPKNVSEDLEYLCQVGLVEFRPSSAHGNARAPVVPYDRVDFSLDLRRRAA
jgi:predicted transcriptional regulator